MQDTDTQSLSHVLSDIYQNGNDVIRCAAIGAISALVPDKGTHDEDRASIRKSLLAGIRDEDPDVRVDAMAAFAPYAEPQDAPLLRESLIEDPVRDVKISATEILAQLQDQESIPLMLKLAQSKATDEFSWEDETDVWDDWLDVQIASISSLETMQVDEAVPLFLELRNDEFGQELDPFILPALAKTSAAGLDALLDLARNSDLKSRSAALRALSESNSELLKSLTPTLASDDLADIRLLAIPNIDPDSALAEKLALMDTDPLVRKAALAQFGPHNQDLVRSALTDEAEAVAATAVELLKLPVDAELKEALFLNGSIWLKKASNALSVASARLLPQLSGNEALPVLAEVLAEPSITLETRLAAIRAISDLGTQDCLNILESQLANPSQQIRVTALSGLADMASQKTANGQLATEILASIIASETDVEADNGTEEEWSAEESHIEAPKTEGTGRPSVRISEDGEIIEDNRDDVSFPTSTLGNIEFEFPSEAAATPETAKSDEGDGLRGHQKKRRRVSVEGPDSFFLDLRLRAISIASELAKVPVVDALESAASCQIEDVRCAAIKALAKHVASNDASQKIEDLMVAALGEENPEIRTPAAQALSHCGRTDLLKPFLQDEDTLMRASAVLALAKEEIEVIVPYFGDASRTVRKIALEAAINSNNQTIILDGLSRAMSAGYSDTIADARALSGKIDHTVFQLLVENKSTPEHCLILLKGLGQKARPQMIA